MSLNYLSVKLATGIIVSGRRFRVNLFQLGQDKYGTQTTLYSK